MDATDPAELMPLVRPLLSSTDPLLRETAVWIAGHHPQWGSDLASLFQSELTALAAQGSTSENRAELKRQLVRFCASEPVQKVLGSTVLNSSEPVLARQLALEAIAESGTKEPPAEWSQAVATSLEAADQPLLEAATAAARLLAQARTNPPDFSSDLLKIADNPAHTARTRLAALAALPGGLPRPEPRIFSFLLAHVNPSTPVVERADACSVLARSKLTDEQYLALAEALKGVGPLEMARLLVAFQHSKDEAVGTHLVEALKTARSLSSVRPDLLQEVLAKYPDEVRNKSREILDLLQVDTARQRAHLEELIASLGKGDIRRGQAIFNSQKAACSSCHAMGYLGGHVGPDLTSIGQVRTERDLLESIVYPSASFVRSYEPYIVHTKSDEDYSGVLKKDAPDEVILVTGPTAEVRVARADITDMRPGTVSLMPAGLEQQLTHQELADLVAFLKATKWGAN
jgi:putative heme-binding domain-containing protein